MVVDRVLRRTKDKQKVAWEILRQLNCRQGVSWLCVGDFNEITKQDENLGGAFRPHN